jgi:hypothetical protein
MAGFDENGRSQLAGMDDTSPEAVALEAKGISRDF